MATFSIVVVTWQSAGHLARLVESMNRHLADDPETAAGAWRGAVRFKRLGANAGVGTAANAGVAEASGEAVVILNPDTELLDPRLGDLASFALRERALAGPRVRNADGTPQPSASGPPAGPWPWVGALLPGALAPAAVRARTEPWRLERTTRVAWLTGACIAGPTDVLRGLGPFDPAIEMYGEDLDLCLRGSADGVPSYLCPVTTEILHHGGASAALRYDAGPEAVVARTRRAVLRRALGERRERSARRAQLLNLRLRIAAKRILGGDVERDRAALAALLSAGTPEELPPAPSPPA